MKRCKQVALIGLLSFSVITYANTYEYTGRCKFNGDMELFKKCLEKERLAFDQELNDIYGGLFKRSHDLALKRSELAWIKFKEADCAFMAATVNEGIYYQIIEQACLIKKTRARIADLKRSFYISEWFNPDFSHF